MSDIVKAPSQLTVDDDDQTIADALATIWTREFKGGVRYLYDPNGGVWGTDEAIASWWRARKKARGIMGDSQVASSMNFDGV